MAHETPAGARSIGLIAAASVAVAMVVLAIKFSAWWATGSVALYSDALESIVNVIASLLALVAIRVSALPADDNHPYGHHKAEYMSAVVEGALIVVAALLIIREAVVALGAPQPITAPVAGILINGAATALNALWAWFLINHGRRQRSPALDADGRHLLADVMTSVGVMIGVMLAVVTGWQTLDPLIALCVAGYVLWTGARLATRSVSGLMDEAASADMEHRIRDIIRANGDGGLQVHDIRTRCAARATFIEFHLVVPGEMTVAASHAICDRLEGAIESAIDGAEVVIHVEPEHKAKEQGAVEL